MTKLESTLDNISLLEELENLKHALKACRPGYNERKIADFRNSLKRSPDTLRFPKDPKGLIVKTEKLEEFCQNLATERAS